MVVEEMGTGGIKMKNGVKRYGWFLAGLVANSFGIALITKAALGTSPISSLPYVLSFRFPFTLGQFSFALNIPYLFVLHVAVGGHCAYLRPAF